MLKMGGTVAHRQISINLGGVVALEKHIGSGKTGFVVRIDGTCTHESTDQGIYLLAIGSVSMNYQCLQ